MEHIRFYLMPRGQMVSSSCGMFGDRKLEKFNEWFSKFERPGIPGISCGMTMSEADLFGIIYLRRE